MVITGGLIGIACSVSFFLGLIAALCIMNWGRP